MIDLTNKLW